MTTRIKIPPVDRDTRIGSVFNMLFRVINETEKIDVYDTIIWDFSESIFFHPFYICGLSLYRTHSERTIRIDGMGNYTKRYLNAIDFESPILVNSSKSIEHLTNAYINKSYIPICKFVTSEKTIDSVTASLQKIIQKQCDIHASMTSPLSYLIGEIVTNIHDHSNCEHGYMFSQYLAKEKCLNVCIADHGITIYGSFAKSKMLHEEWMDNEGAVLEKALNHISTKNLPNAENRGYGLPTTKTMLVEGMGGEFFILSGGAFHRHDKNGKATVCLPPTIYWNGTIVLLKIPIEMPSTFNYLKYTERI